MESTTTAGYVRVSSDDQKFKNTIATQRDEITAFAVQHDLQLAYYEDDGHSGVVPLGERPAGKRLLADIDAGRITRVIVFDLTRLARGRRADVMSNTVYDLLERGCRVTSIYDHEDFLPGFADDEDANDIGLVVRSWYSSNERKKFLLRTRLGKLRSARESRWWGGPLPYGYATDAADKRLILDDTPAGAGMTRAEVVALIFDRAANGMASGKIATLLNSMGIPSPFAGRKWEGVPRLGKWRHNAILRILHRDWYHGEHLYTNRRGEQVQVTVPAIVTRATWDAVQRTLTANEHAPRNATRPYPLRGHIRCGKCGYAMVGEAYRNGQRTYRCTSRREALNIICPASTVNATWLEWEAWRGILEQLRAYTGEIATQDAAGNRPDPNALARELDAVQGRLDALDGQRSRLVTAYSEALITGEDMAAQLQRIDGEKKQVQTIAADLRRRHVVFAHALPPRIEELRAAASLIADDDVTPDLLAEVLGLMVEGVTVTATRRDMTATVRTLLGEFTVSGEKKR